MTVVHVHLSERLTDLLAPWLVEIATSDPADGCECLYLVVDWLTVVFHMFA